MDGRASPAFENLDPGERRWLHDKYERLAAEEGQLSASRTAYFATIGAVLLTGIVVILADLLSQPILFAIAASLLSSLGILTSAVWTVLLHRTNDAQAMWREAALHLEQVAPPVTVSVPSQVTLRSSATLPVDLSAPYRMHVVRFSSTNHISYLDRFNPNRLMEVMPVTLLVIWNAVLVLVWGWYLFGR
ncbi:MAG: hypothetical protein L3K02_05590 [Thermoplasmata archaeon]|nr:hypothetical protein [Thermoplasmata archaeon]